MHGRRLFEIGAFEVGAIDLFFVQAAVEIRFVDSACTEGGHSAFFCLFKRPSRLDLLIRRARKEGSLFFFLHRGPAIKKRRGKMKSR